MKANSNRDGQDRQDEGEELTDRFIESMSK
jgi:hypothetical protein